MKTHSFRIILGDSPETHRKLCVSTNFLHKEIRCNYGILYSVLLLASIFLHCLQLFLFWQQFLQTQRHLSSRDVTFIFFSKNFVNILFFDIALYPKYQGIYLVCMKLIGKYSFSKCLTWLFASELLYLSLSNNLYLYFYK